MKQRRSNKNWVAPEWYSGDDGLGGCEYKTEGKDRVGENGFRRGFLGGLDVL